MHATKRRKVTKYLGIALSVKGSAGFYRVLHGATRFGSTRFYKVLPGFGSRGSAEFQVLGIQALPGRY
jgi:hypothetical protein